MSSDNSSKLDIAPLTIVVTDALDPRVRRQLEAEQQGDVKTYEELTKQMEMQEDFSKIKKEVEDNGDETDPFEQPEPTENNAPPPETQQNAQQPDQTQTPASNDTQEAQPPAEQQSAPEAGTESPQNPATPQNDNAGDEEDLSSAFESHGTNIPVDLVRRVVKDYIKMESSDAESVGELEHIKTFVYIDLGTNTVSGDTLESVQTLRDPENTIVVINEATSPDANTTLKARSVAEQLTNRGVKVFYDVDEAINYLNDLYDVVSGRTKGSE